MSEYARRRLAQAVQALIGSAAIVIIYMNCWSVWPTAFALAVLVYITDTTAEKRVEWRYRHLEFFLKEQDGPNSPYSRTPTGHIYPRGGQHQCDEPDCPARQP